MTEAGVADLEGRLALVTGGARRIGRGIGLALAEACCDVVVHYGTSDEKADRTVDEIRAAGQSAHAVQADLRDETAVAGLLDAASDAAGRRVDLLVNNASTFPEKRWDAATYGDLDETMRVHAWAPLVLTRALHNAGGGAVVNLLDARIAARDPAHAPYLLSKQALWHLTRDLAREFAPRTRVNGVAPGPILPPPKGSAEALEAARRVVPMQTIGSVENVADAVLFLLRNEYVTGDVVFVDGGRHLLG